MKFSIRDLFLVTVIVALVLGWWVDQQQQAANVEKWRERASKLEFGELARQVTEVRKGMTFIPVSAAEPPKRGWLSFSIRDLFWLTAIVAVVLWALYARPLGAGRYSMENNQMGQTFVLDTATGQCWMRDQIGRWTDVACPPSLKK